ncbi:MAG TPA: DUF881 domain-containing protein [Intrasporangiaceae bacterium]|nr:DUF881 domain-containing protein [Intrasporangiaceae bacterium]
MTAPPGRARDASMSLINELLTRPLDPGYAAAAERRRRAGEDEPQRPTGTLVLVTALVIGLIFGVSAASLRDRQTERTEARSQLVAQIEARQDRVSANSARVSELQNEVALAQEQVLRDSMGAVAAGVTSQLLASAGAVEVSGPGLVVTIDDAPVTPGADPSVLNEGKVRSRDLQIVVNALWAAGAESIDVGGQRLTSRSAIRFAGEAILVNYRPLTRPYVVRAIGDPERLSFGFASGDAGAYLKALSDNYGIQVSTTSEQQVTMTSASAIQVRYATTKHAEVDQ